MRAAASAGSAVDAGRRAEADAPGGIHWAGRLFRVVAIAEAITWAGLLLGMALKYGPVGTEAGVWLFGRLHGGVFVAYLAVTLLAAWQLRWRWWVVLLALAASIPPLVTIVLEAWLELSGRLARRASTGRSRLVPAPVTGVPAPSGSDADLG